MIILASISSSRFDIIIWKHHLNFPLTQNLHGCEAKRVKKKEILGENFEEMEKDETNCITVMTEVNIAWHR